MQRRRYVSIVVLIALLFLTTSVVFAKKTSAPASYATLTTRWTPDAQLSSISGDTRTVSLKMSVTIDRQFWAMDVSCSLSQLNVFESDGQTMTWSPAWTSGDSSTNYFDSTVDADNVASGTQYFDAVNNRINASITRVGAANTPVGYNGTTYTQDLFDLELTISEGVIGVAPVELTCDKIEFLNRDGESVDDSGAIVALVQSNTLTVRDGYHISGSALRQASENQTDMNVQCEHIDGNLYDTDTETTVVLDKKGNVVSATYGAFSFEKDLNGTDPLRDFGLYECTFMSNMGGSEDTVFLRGRSYINLQTPDYELQPIVVPGGDTDNSGDITVTDFVDITDSWQMTVTPFTDGDVNGDGFVDQTDLTIAAGNVGLSESDGGVMMDHVLYSVARDYNGTFPNNTLNMGNVVSGQVSALSTTRSFWPQVSPDGSSIAFFMDGLVAIEGKKNKFTYVQQQGLAISAVDGSNVNILAEGYNFAPSWSPSGGQIAYICSWEGYLDANQNLYGYENNNGNLCITSSTGDNTKTIIPSGQQSTYAEIFPPAWYDENIVLYAGNDSNTICPDQICYYNIQTDTHGLVDINGVDGANNDANMPVIVRYSDSLTYLYYRYFTSSDTSELRMGTLSYVFDDDGDSIDNSWDTSSVVANGIDTNYLHEVVDGTDGGVHYYDVSPMLDVMFYEFGDYQFQNLIFSDTGTEYEWTETDAHMVDGFVGYPMLNQQDNVWDGYDEINYQTDFHAYRATFDWLP